MQATHLRYSAHDRRLDYTRLGDSRAVVAGPTAWDGWVGRIAGWPASAAHDAGHSHMNTGNILGERVVLRVFEGSSGAGGEEAGAESRRRSGTGGRLVNQHWHSVMMHGESPGPALASAPLLGTRSRGHALHCDMSMCAAPNGGSDPATCCR